MSLREEFKTFVLRGNVIDLAVGVVIGASFGKIVSSLVEGLIMPIVGYVVPSGDWKTFAVGKFQIGAVAGATLDFVLISLVVFLVFVKGFNALKRKQEEAPAPATKECPFCLETVPAAARRCKHCTSELPAAA